jgi:hypothetical protein
MFASAGHSQQRRELAAEIDSSRFGLFPPTMQYQLKSRLMRQKCFRGSSGVSTYIAIWVNSEGHTERPIHQPLLPEHASCVHLVAKLRDVLDCNGDMAEVS